MAIIYTTHIRDSISIPFHSPWSYVNLILLLGASLSTWKIGRRWHAMNPLVWLNYYPPTTTRPISPILLYGTKSGYELDLMGWVSVLGWTTPYLFALNLGAWSEWRDPSYEIPGRTTPLLPTFYPPHPYMFLALGQKSRSQSILAFHTRSEANVTTPPYKSFALVICPV